MCVYIYIYIYIHTHSYICINTPYVHHVYPPFELMWCNHCYDVEHTLYPTTHDAIIWCVYICVIHIYIYIYMYVYMYVCMYVCIYIYIYTHTLITVCVLIYHTIPYHDLPSRVSWCDTMRDMLRYYMLLCTGTIMWRETPRVMWLCCCGLECKPMVWRMCLEFATPATGTRIWCGCTVAPMIATRFASYPDSWMLTWGLHLNIIVGVSQAKAVRARGQVRLSIGCLWPALLEQLL